MPLTPAQMTQLETVLTAEKARILKNAQEGLAFSMNRDRNIGRDSIDESMEEELFSTELRLRDREKWLLGKVNEALSRLKEGVIDDCEDCDEPIGYKRLLARPVTTFCIACKEEREREEESTAAAAGGRDGGVGDGGDAQPEAEE